MQAFIDFKKLFMKLIEKDCGTYEEYDVGEKSYHQLKAYLKRVEYFLETPVV